MSATDNKEGPPEFPESLAPPCAVEESTETIELWSGQAEFKQPSGTQTGEARVFIDTLPFPTARFTFQASSQELTAGGISQLRRLFDTAALNAGILRCGGPIGPLKVSPWNISGGTFNGGVEDWETSPDEGFTSAKLLVINGPVYRGSAIRKGQGVFVGRSQVNADDMMLTVDRLSSVKQSARSIFGFTHVAEIRFDSLQPIARFEAAIDMLFRTLALMRGRWVGLVGPWFYVDATLHLIRPCVTKTTRNGAYLNWCPDIVLGVFEELFTRLQAAYLDTDRADALQTAIHWLIESNQCAGGVEGSIILVQAALEALAWFEVVQRRKLCSVSGFDKLPATDKIRWFLSIYSIPMVVPAHYAELTSYAAEYQLDDLPGILADVRNALIHGSPKKVKRLFGRQRGEDERTALWYFATGLLEQAVLAVAGYRGKIMRRDVDVQWKSGAVKQVPWRPNEQIGSI